MKKVNIIKENVEFNRIINSINPYKSRNFIIYLEEIEENNYKFGISVGKKIGKAVVRNKLKRQIRNIIDKNSYQKNFKCIIILKKSVLNINYNEMEEEINYLFKKLKLIKEKENEKNN